MRASDLIERGRRAILDEGDRLDAEGRERMEAEELLAFVLGAEPGDGDVVPAPAVKRYERLLARRTAGEPLAFIVGTTAFAGMRLHCGPGAFIPRESSAFMVEQAVRRLRRRRSPVAIDVATGVGPVALSIARRLVGAEVHGADLSTAAVSYARRSARTLGLRNARFHSGDLFEALPRRLRGRADVVTAHPPYVARADVRDLPVEIRDFEPVTTLTDGSRDGLGLVRRVAAEAPAWLRPDGWLLMEVMTPIARDVRRIMSREGYRDVRSTRGAVRYTRVLVGRSPVRHLSRR